MNRRQFLQSATMGAAALNAFPHHLFAGTTKKSVSDRVKLGPRKVEVSRLAMGTGTNGGGGGSNQTRQLGFDGMTDMFKAAYDQGITFWDSADTYGSHAYLQRALKAGIPREKVTILTKTESLTAKDMRADLDRFRKELGTDYIDILLLHYLHDDEWPENRKGAMEVISEAQEKGIVRTKGVSCHTLGALKLAAASPWVEVDLARFNPAEVLMDSDVATVRGVLRQMKAKGKGVIGMKILGAGALRSKPDECLQFALAQDFLDCFTIGQESRAEMQDLVRRIPAASVRG
ncbi:MAG: aldo/keto reductase [Bryobacteraceae bacterium]|jgi:aryl-alcohol dehydrogenase-like predicted oxidoreductase